MGQAKRRGTKAQRTAQAIERQDQEYARISGVRELHKREQAKQQVLIVDDGIPRRRTLTTILLGASIAALHSPILCEPEPLVPRGRTIRPLKIKE